MSKLRKFFVWFRDSQRPDPKGPGPIVRDQWTVAYWEAQGHSRQEAARFAKLFKTAAIAHARRVARRKHGDR